MILSTALLGVALCLQVALKKIVGSRLLEAHTFMRRMVPAFVNSHFIIITTSIDQIFTVFSTPSTLSSPLKKERYFCLLLNLIKIECK